jgi:hypothetical protein
MGATKTRIGESGSWRAIDDERAQTQKLHSLIMKLRWLRETRVHPNRGSASPARNNAQVEAIMDLRFLSRNAESAARNRNDIRRRGYTYRGDKVWDAAELEILQSTRHLTVADVRKQLPHRTAIAIDRCRVKTGIVRRKLTQWTTHEDRILRAKIGLLHYTEIAKLLPGRSVHAVQGRAWYLGFRKGCLRSPKPKGLPVYDDVRSRAYEDGLSMQALDGELGTGKYFQDNHQKTLNWKKLALALWLRDCSSALAT